MSVRIVVLAGIVVACGRDAPDRQVLIVRAVDDGSALVVWRDSSPEQSVERIGPDARVQWSTKLDGDVASFGRRDRGIVVGSHHVAVRTYRRIGGGLEEHVEMLALQDGKKTSVTLGVVETEGELGQFPGYVTAETVSEEFGRVLVSIDMRTGTVVSKLQLPFVPVRAVVRANDVVLQRGYADALISQGEVRVLEGNGCVMANRRWQLRKDGDRYSLGTDEGTPQRLSLDRIASDADLEHCARYKDRTVVALGVTPPGELRRQELRILGADGALIGRVPLELGSLPPTLVTETLPRFVPIFRVEERGIDMIDLETGQIAWRVPPTALFDDPFESGGRWYISTQSAIPEVAVIDATTGRLLVAKRLVTKHGLQPPGRNNISRQGMWVSPASWRPGAEPLASRLDPTTLAHVGGAPVQVEDISAASPFTAIPRN